MPWQKIPALQSVVKQISDKNGRRLQTAMMSEECTTACPKVMDFLTAVKDEGADMAKVLELYCPKYYDQGDSRISTHEETVTCLLATAACQDEGGADAIQMFKPIACMCACKGLANDPKIGTTLTTEQCEAVICRNGEAMHGEGTCKPIMESLGEDGKKQAASCMEKVTQEGKISADDATQAGPVAFLVLSVTSLFV